MKRVTVHATIAGKPGKFRCVVPDDPTAAADDLITNLADSHKVDRKLVTINHVKEEIAEPLPTSDADKTRIAELEVRLAALESKDDAPKKEPAKEEAPAEKPAAKKADK